MSDMPFDFQDKTVFVAGGSSGINLGVAECFARANARVAICSRSADRVSAAVNHLRGMGGEAWGGAADVRNPEAMERVFAAAAEQYGPIDIVISGAAGNFPATAHGMSTNGFRTVVDIDLNGTFNVMKAAHPHLRLPGASLINISAPQAFMPMPAQVHVCAAKAGVDMVTKVLAMEWGPEGIRVNSIAPGPIENTEGMKRLAPNSQAEAGILERLPLRRYGNAGEIGAVAMFLASPWASYVTGTVIPVDGGLSAAGPGGFSDILAGIGQPERARVVRPSTSGKGMPTP